MLFEKAESALLLECLMCGSTSFFSPAAAMIGVPMLKTCKINCKILDA